MLDDGDFAICNNEECSKKDECRRYNKEIEASYNFSYIVTTDFNCFVKKEVELKEMNNKKEEEN